MAREEFAALVFGPGLPPGGVPGELIVSSFGLEISADEHSRTIDVPSLALRKVGFEKPGVELAWRDGTDTWAVHVLDPVAAQRLLSAHLAHTPQAQSLTRARRKRSVGRSLVLSAIILIALLPLLLLGLAIMNANALTGWVTDKIPIEQEIEYGRQIFSGVRENLKLKDEGPAYDAAQSIVDKLTQGSKYPYEVHVSDDPVPNAFAIPGGIIVVNSGLIAITKRPEELAGVLAHEVEHVELRHSIRRMVKDLGLRGLWASVTGNLDATFVGQTVIGLKSLKFSRDDESEADDRGFDAMVNAGIDPRGIQELFKTLSEKAGDAPAFLSTHPRSEAREAQLRERLAGLGTREFARLDFGAWPPVGRIKSQE